MEILYIFFHWLDIKKILLWDSFIIILLLYFLYGKKIFSCVHNLFIAIIEQKFSSLRTQKPVQGDESSDDEDVELKERRMSPRMIKLQEMAEKSKK